jgi:hypothetical protein
LANPPYELTYRADEEPVEVIVTAEIEAVSLDSTIVAVHSDGAGAKKTPRTIGKSRG